MKIFNTQEKAKAYDDAKDDNNVDWKQKYDEAFERAEILIEKLEPNHIKGFIYHIFPELKESNDEKIRKELIEFLKSASGGFLDTTIQCKTFGKWLTWLEKQGWQKTAVYAPKFHVGDKLVSTKNPRLTYEVLEVGHINELGNPEYKVEIFTDAKAENPHNIHYMECRKVDKWAELIEQKTTDKVEQKFKVGDWCIDNEDDTIFQIVKVLDNTYTYRTNEGKEYSGTHYSLEDDARLWTIQDAKDGDVLTNDEYIFIYNNTCILQAYCYYHTQNAKFYIEDRTHHHKWVMSEVKPTTKEQHELLFSKMKEAGCEWDSEKKELLK